MFFQNSLVVLLRIGVKSIVTKNVLSHFKNTLKRALRVYYKSTSLKSANKQSVVESLRTSSK